MNTTPQPLTLFIVESPTKVRTIEKYLGDNFIVAASVGHIADIPKREGSVDVKNDFAATYELTEKGRAVIADLKKLMKRCSQVILATDADREGELIAAHLLEFLKPSVPYHRVVFHAVTKDAIEEALQHPRDIDWKLVEAARARRVLDRLFGFEVSDVSRRKVRTDTTAGRVQSPALCLVVEREYERMLFVSAEYADVVAQSATTPPITAALKKINGQTIATGKDFDSAGVLLSSSVQLTRHQAELIAREISDGVSSLAVSDISEKPMTRNPQPPFIMSSLYQDALNRLGMSMKEAEGTANALFDKGLITYPRTDNPVHDPASRGAIRTVIADLFGKDFVSPTHRYTSSKKKAQGAHEAIRPTYLNVQKPNGLTERQQAMYLMIWQRTLASQMVEAKGITRTLTLSSLGGTDATEFSTSGTTYYQAGFRSVYTPTTGDEIGTTLPALSVGEIVPIASAEARMHQTNPPPRFTEASLVKELEERGIGRPSTYASINAKLRERYVWNKKNDRALIPTVTAFAVHRLLVNSFGSLVDYSFTSHLEDQLDMVAEDKARRDELLDEFYFGSSSTVGLHALVANAIATVKGVDMYAMSFGLHPETGEQIILRAGRKFGKSVSPYIECGTTTVSIPDHTEFADLSVEAILRLIAKSEPRLLGEINGIPVFSRYTESGTYLQWGGKEKFPNGAKKPRSMNILSSMNPDDLSLADAERMFSLPRTVGLSPDGLAITATVGKFGGYITCGDETRSLKQDESVFTITEAEAIDLLNQPKKKKNNWKGKRSGKGN